ncbi:MAG TPA: hypothetical protein VIG48_05305 [Jatrophihabitans sp.]|jgi:hypothetical protein
MPSGRPAVEAAQALSPLTVVVIVVVVFGAMALTSLWRRRRANEAAAQLGGEVVTGPLPAGQQPLRPPPGTIGAPNPGLPPAAAPDQRTGILTSGPPVQLSVCGLPALVWQRSEHTDSRWEPMRLSLIADTAAGLPVLHLYHRSGALAALGDGIGQSQPSGVPSLDAAYRFAGDLAAWAPVLGAPGVQQALLTFPLDTLSVLGGRITLVSREGVHLDPGATSAIAQVAAALITAIPPGLAVSPSGLPAGPGGADAVVQAALARSGLTPEQQQAMLALVRASRHPSPPH